MWELERLREFVRELEKKLEKLQKQKRALSKKGFTVRYIKCGKESCRICSSGQGHGPYVYKTVREEGKVKSIYLGKLETLDKLRNMEYTLDQIKNFEEEIAKIEKKLAKIRKKVREILEDVGN